MHLCEVRYMHVTYRTSSVRGTEYARATSLLPSDGLGVKAVVPSPTSPATDPSCSRASAARLSLPPSSTRSRSDAGMKDVAAASRAVGLGGSRPPN